MRFGDSRYYKFEPTASNEILQYLGVEKIENTTGRAIIYDRFSDPLVDCPYAEPRHKRSGDQGYTEKNEYYIKAYDKVLGVYRRVSGHAVVESVY